MIKTMPWRVGDELETDQANIYNHEKPTCCVEYSELFDDDVTVTYMQTSLRLDGVVLQSNIIRREAFYKNTALKKIILVVAWRS